MSVVHLELESSAGNLDLSSYINVQAGAGMDPFDPAFSSRMFAHSLLKQGGVLALEDLKLKEMTFPLTLTATSKDKLTALVRELNTILGTAGCEVKWSDEGTAISTFFNLASGQFDIEFDFRQGQQSKPMLKGKLRLFVQPLGQIEKSPRLWLQAGGAATLTGTTPVMVFHSASPLRGDAPALAEAVFPTPSAGYYAAFSVLPNASYNPFQPASSARTVGTGWKATQSANDGVVNVGIGNANPLNFTQEAGVVVGSHRALVLAKRVIAASDVRIGIEGSTIVPGILAASDATRSVDVPSPTWTLLDCGVVSRGTVPGLAWNLALSSTATVAIGGLVLLPENSTVWLSEQEATLAQTALIVSGVESAVRVESGTGIPRSMAGKARGAIPTLPAGPTAASCAFLLLNALNPTWSRSVFMLVQERTRYVF